MTIGNCISCALITGGCARHNGSGLYVFDPNGQMKQTHAFVTETTPTGIILTLQPLDTGVLDSK